MVGEGQRAAVDRAFLNKYCSLNSKMLFKYMKEISYSKEALRTLRKMPKNTSEHIRMKIEQYAADPVSLTNNVIQMQGYDGYFRLRVGDWRVIFSENRVVIAVIKIAARGSAYN